MFEEWISIQNAITAGHFVQHGLLNSSLCRHFKGFLSCGFQIKTADGKVNL